MVDLATFLVLPDGLDRSIPKEVANALERNGWRPVKENILYALPWDSALKENGGRVQRLVDGVEKVRDVLARRGIRYRFETYDNAL